ncbi:PREDICTED: transcription factor BIM2 isoform X2 [Theobroma cacao]|uniref:Transcription factor BIM2 isoform X2 n=2 Tax=Theobroma cacao TaxID=3641 RepID=A0AB32VA32_THECC|nr:PREDICTED: transcription factor BIM2 isoform X2 [Theobroma cacao]EOY03823.1 BES1-interacting Myc-like protein 2, putative isoform 2 [Theobroma cacao]
MVKPVATAQLHQEEEDEDDYEDKGETVKEGKGSEPKANTNRSKHSETEQRRRSKINERFQTLRDLIPQNDQKRDKASFLLEVIEYIQFLQEKLQMYEGSYQGWSQEPTKLIPWRNHGLPESFIDNSQVMKNGSSFFKALDHPPGSATSVVNMQTQPNTFATHGRGSIPTQSFHESASDSENVVYRPQFQSWQSRECLTESAVPNNSANGQEDLTIRDDSVGLSSAYSQGILNSLTQALQSSGVDMSQASISVQIDVGKRVASGVTSMASSSKEKEIQYRSNQMMAQTGAHSYTEESDQAYKRRRTGKS